MLREITADNAIEYLREQGQLQPEEVASAEALAWGVSNIVIRIDREAEADFVIKQSRKQLRTQAEWFSQLERIWRELEVMQELQQLLPASVVPRVLFEDRENYLFAMEAIAADHKVWKAELLDGRFDQAIARELGSFLGAIHRRTFLQEQYQQRWGDWEIFDQLRIDPFYRFIVRAHPEIKDWVAALIEEMSAHRLCLVLADFSPKNILITEQQIHLVDFETAHFGDPAFDLGFFLSHLLLKAVHFQAAGIPCIELAEIFWDSYLNSDAVEPLEPGPEAAKMEEPQIGQRTIKHLAACMLARVDGKSTVDYLSDSTQQDLVRSFALSLILNPPESIPDAFARLKEMLIS
ncbi:Methylthioribose kinase [Gimesia panareensis]|uniref:Methylthioribose kinase n=1 Tax=Gimesia panareensis TaxID=2527978 RepID=A0A518FR17_9PLAN|nr:aminoglycoside phosphotransferase family protein [Gimesia panareensis]QDV18797.1 Methylthioribose kinase [Gimesia panareensis]